MIAAASFTVGLSDSVASARADPTSDKVIDIFLKQKATSRGGICFGTVEECPPLPPPLASFDLLVNFDPDSEALTETAKDNLDNVARALLDPRLKGERFEVDAYTDAVGDAAYNLALSERRADAVVSYLISRGMEPSSLIPRGFGSLKPRVADRYSPENRRVEMHLAE